LRGEERREGAKERIRKLKRNELTATTTEKKR